MEEEDESANGSPPAGRGGGGGGSRSYATVATSFVASLNVLLDDLR